MTSARHVPRGFNHSETACDARGSRPEIRVSRGGRFVPPEISIVLFITFTSGR